MMKEKKHMKTLSLERQFINFEPLPILKGIVEYINTLKGFFNFSSYKGEKEKNFLERGPSPFEHFSAFSPFS